MKITNLHAAIVSTCTYIHVHQQYNNYIHTQVRITMDTYLHAYIYFIYHLGNKSEITELQRVSRLILIHDLSPVLILQLKRFSIGSFSVVKDGEYVSFPLVLNMTPYCTSECFQVYCLHNVFL